MAMDQKVNELREKCRTKESNDSDNDQEGENEFGARNPDNYPYSGYNNNYNEQVEGKHENPVGTKRKRKGEPDEVSSSKRSWKYTDRILNYKNRKIP
eukprot:UN20789